MAQIRGKDTKPELAVRSALHRLGFRFTLNNTNIPGKPDLVLPKYKSTIFVHGCFWHRHKDCKFAYTPKSRTDFWQEKFAKNVQRDEKVMKQISSLGWNPIVIWECEVKSDLESAVKRIARDLISVEHKQRVLPKLLTGGSK